MMTAYNNRSNHSIFVPVETAWPKDGPCWLDGAYRRIGQARAA